MEETPFKPPRVPEPQRFGASKGGMVATAHWVATKAGCWALEQGGNAVDAAVASALALGVAEPAGSGLGGQTMMVIHLAAQRRSFFLDGSSRAPNRILERAKKSTRSGRQASTVPSTPAILEYAVRRYGRLTWSQVLQPAIAAAKEGIVVSELLSALAKRERRKLILHGGARFMLPDGKAPKPGSRLFQPVLAQTLERLAREGVEDFYRGGIAERIVADMEENGGLIRADDLAQMPWPVERRTVSTKLRSLRLVTAPPPAAGPTLIAMVNMLSSIGLDRVDIDEPEGALLLAEVIRQAFLDREDRPFDPTYYRQERDIRVLSKTYASRRAKEIKMQLRKPRGSHGETTHLSVMDKDGSAVALTQSIEYVFGSGAAAADLGFMFNNYIAAFEVEDAAHPYFLRPNAVPWASVAPTIGFRSGRPTLVIGSPGSERITSSILQVLLRLEKQSPLDAVAAPRLHCSTEGKVSCEGPRMRSDVLERLTEAGYELDIREAYAFYLGCVQLVMRRRGRFIGVADPRRDGSAEGPRDAGSSDAKSGTTVKPVRRSKP